MAALTDLLGEALCQAAQVDQHDVDACGMGGAHAADDKAMRKSAIEVEQLPAAYRR